MSALHALWIVPGALIGLCVFVLYLWSVIWSYSDAEKRGKSGCLVALLVAFLQWPLGLILWVVFRPERRY